MGASIYLLAWRDLQVALTNLAQICYAGVALSDGRVARPPTASILRTSRARRSGRRFQVVARWNLARKGPATIDARSCAICSTHLAVQGPITASEAPGRQIYTNPPALHRCRLRFRHPADLSLHHHTERRSGGCWIVSQMQAAEGPGIAPATLAAQVKTISRPRKEARAPLSAWIARPDSPKP